MMSDTKLCPYCNGEIKSGAIKCKHCKSMLDRVENETKQIKIEHNVTEEKIILPEGTEYIGP
jgi:DnaJ-class molecular chaperone